MTESTKGMTAEEAIRERITKAKEGKEKLWTQHENAQDDSSKQMFFLLYKEIAGHVDEAEAILLLLKTDRTALAKRVWEIQHLLLNRKYGTPEFNDVHLAITTLATELESKSEMR